MAKKAETKAGAAAKAGAPKAGAPDTQPGRRRVTFNAYAADAKLRAAKALLAARGMTISDWLTEQLEILATEAESKGFRAEE